MNDNNHRAEPVEFDSSVQHEVNTGTIHETGREVVFGKEIVRRSSDSVLGNVIIGASSILHPREAFAIIRDSLRSKVSN